jgi:hypothetical protein
MFDSFLSCRTFWLRRGEDRQFVELARRWSGQRNLDPSGGGAVVWDDRPQIEIGDDTWSRSAEKFQINVRHALIPLGKIHRVEAFVFVSPFSSVSASFKETGYGYISHRDEKDEQSEQLPGFQVDFNAFVRASWKDYADRIRSVEWVTPAKKYVVVSTLTPFLPDEQTPFSKFDLRSVSLEIAGCRMKVYKDLSIELGDTTVEPEVATTYLEQAIEMFRPHIVKNYHLAPSVQP